MTRQMPAFWAGAPPPWSPVWAEHQPSTDIHGAGWDADCPPTPGRAVPPCFHSCCPGAADDRVRPQIFSIMCSRGFSGSAQQSRCPLPQQTPPCRPSQDCLLRFSLPRARQPSARVSSRCRWRRLWGSEGGGPVTMQTTFTSSSLLFLIWPTSLNCVVWDSWAYRTWEGGQMGSCPCKLRCWAIWSLLPSEGTLGNGDRPPRARQDAQRLWPVLAMLAYLVFHIASSRLDTCLTVLLHLGPVAATTHRVSGSVGTCALRSWALWARCGLQGSVWLRIWLCWQVRAAEGLRHPPALASKPDRDQNNKWTVASLLPTGLPGGYAHSS